MKYSEERCRRYAWESFCWGWSRIWLTQEYVIWGRGKEWKDLCLQAVDNFPILHIVPPVRDMQSIYAPRVEQICIWNWSTGTLSLVLWPILSLMYSPLLTLMTMFPKFKRMSAISLATERTDSCLMLAHTACIWLVMQWPYRGLHGDATCPSTQRSHNFTAGFTSIAWWTHPSYSISELFNVV